MGWAKSRTLGLSVLEIKKPQIILYSLIFVSIYPFDRTNLVHKNNKGRNRSLTIK